MSHYEDYCKTACAGCAQLEPRPAAAVKHHWHGFNRCEALPITLWAEQQFERAERNWKAGADALRPFAMLASRYRTDPDKLIDGALFAADAVYGSHMLIAESALARYDAAQSQK